MSGIVGSNLNIKGSGLVATLGTDGQVLTSSGAGVTAAFEDVAGGISWQAIETGSTMTAVAGEAYWIDTTSNACTITLPSSASNGDEIIFTDYDRTWGTNGIVIDSNGLNYQGDDDSFDVEYGTDGQTVHIVYSGATNGWIPILDEDVSDVPVFGNQNGIFGFGFPPGGVTAVTNLVTNVGVVGSDVTGVGTVRYSLAACGYGGDKGIFGYGNTTGTPARVSMTNLVSNAGVVATDTTGVGTARTSLGACEYGGDKGIFSYGIDNDSTQVSMKNLVSNVGVVATDVTGVGTARSYLAACSFGTNGSDKGIFAYGTTGSLVSLSNLVSNVGVVATDVTGVGTAREQLAATEYGDDKAIFGFGEASGGRTGITNLVSNVGVVATDTAGVGTARGTPGACTYGIDKGIFAYGADSSGDVSYKNLVSTTGVVASDVTGVGTARNTLAACEYN
jgi:hypothetical protein